ncbi:MAG: tRNA (adenosine(37)-N6)-threonylcarbamoyltransferase complex dimerization subunit type 1 TsaB [Hyphomicrobiales bacterium]|nr:tRNA (adenosine(37)-N6)-threonylcarbamoyltransferase complex dimerization subunit type 1 TsaB [Hyphomicrobiales bacterium]
MKILAIDTALGACSACVYESTTGQLLGFETLAMQRGHAEALPGLVGKIRDQLLPGLDQVERVAVTVGPGSFTGIRVGIAAARALGLALDVPVVGVSTLSAFAAPLLGDESRAAVAAAIDARHGAIYVMMISASGAMQVTPRLLKIDQAALQLPSGTLRICGSGAALLAAAARQRGLSCDMSGALDAPDISYVARLGALADPASAPPDPLYLKAPDVTPPGRAAAAS